MFGHVTSTAVLVELARGVVCVWQYVSMAAVYFERTEVINERSPSCSWKLDIYVVRSICGSGFSTKVEETKVRTDYKAKPTVGASYIYSASTGYCTVTAFLYLPLFKAFGQFGV